MQTYILQTIGRIDQPTLTVTIRAKDDDAAIAEATSQSQKIASGDYRSFTLWNDDNGQSAALAGWYVTMVPTVQSLKRRKAV